MAIVAIAWPPIFVGWSRVGGGVSFVNLGYGPSEALTAVSRALANLGDDGSRGSNSRGLRELPADARVGMSEKRVDYA